MESLLIFDIDGTLLQSVKLQTMCLERALRLCLNCQFSLEDAQATTDAGIFAEIHQKISGRPPLPSEQDCFRSFFFAELEQAFACGEDVVATLGANNVLAGSLNGRDVAVAVGTGGFESVSRLKMERAGLSMEDIPAAFAEDGFTKEEVLRASLLRAESHYGARFQEVVYIGDASYDVRAAERLNFRFVGIGAGKREKRLLSCGAKIVIPDLTHLHRVLERRES